LENEKKANDREEQIYEQEDLNLPGTSKAIKSKQKSQV
jgi:hypothetical protein